MITILCFAAASFMLGMFFNSYALIALCAVVAMSNLLTIFSAGLTGASMTMVVDLIVIQIGFLAGLSASSFVPVSKRATLPSSKI
jgi:hypothetical protein